MVRAEVRLAVLPANADGARAISAVVRRFSGAPDVDAVSSACHDAVRGLLGVHGSYLELTGRGRAVSDVMRESSASEFALRVPVVRGELCLGAIIVPDECGVGEAELAQDRLALIADLAADALYRVVSDEERRLTHDAERLASEFGVAALAQLVSEAVVGVDESGVVVLWNAGAERLVGWTAAEIVGRPWASVARTTGAGSGASGVPEAPGVAREVALLRPDGVRLALFGASAFVARGGGAMRLCVLRRSGDVDRVEENRLAESEEARAYAHALLVLSQRNPDDVEGFIRAVNELCVTALRVDRCGVWGWQGESLVCFDVYDTLAAAHEVVPNIHAAAHPAYTSAIRSEQPIVAFDVREHASTRSLVAQHLEPFAVQSTIDMPTQFFRESRGVIRVEACRPRRWRETEVRFVANVATMVVQMCARAEHRRALAHHSAVLSSIRDAVVACDQDGAVTVMNAVAEELTGWSRAEAAGRSIDEVVRVAPRERGLASPQCAVLVNRRGERLDVTYSEAAVVDAQVLCGSVLVLRDVSVEVRARRELEREHQQLQAMSAAIPDDVYTVSLAGEFSWRKPRGHGHDTSGAGMPGTLQAELGVEVAARVQTAVRHAVELREIQVIEFATARPGRGLETFEARVARVDDSSACVLVRDVTQERRRAAELRAHQESLDSMLNATSAIVYSARLADRRVEYVSGSIQRILGYSPAEAVDPDFWARRLHPDDRERVLSSLERLYTEGSQVREYRHEHRDGTYRWLRDEVRVVYDDDGVPRRAIGASFDVTTRRYDEARLRSMAAVQGLIGRLSHRLLTRQIDPFEVLDEGLQALGQALEAKRVCVYTVEAGRGSALHEWCSTERGSPRGAIGELSATDHDFLFAPLEQSAPHFLGRGRGSGEDEQVRRVLGACGVEGLVLAPIARDGRLEGVVVIEEPRLDVLSEQDHGALLVLFGDIVGGGLEQRRVEQGLHRLTGELEQRVVLRSQELAASELRFATLFEHAPQALLVVGPAGRIRQANARAAAVFGAEVGALREKALAELIPEGDRVAHAEYLRDFCGAPRQMLEGRAVTALRADGASFAAEIGLVPLDLDGERVLLAGVVDVSARVAAQAAIDASLREKETLLKEIHHRVKNNLQIVASLLQLQAAVADDGVRQVLVESVFRVRSMAMVHEHLYGTDSLAAVELTTFVRRLVEMVRAGLGRGGRVLVEGAPVMVSVDVATPMGLIINELVTNALKYGAPKDGADAILPWDVRVSVSGDEAEPRVEVADRGVGLPQPLELLAETTLGLRLVRALARQLHGRLELVGDVGVCARIIVPIERPLARPSQRPSTRSSSDGNHGAC